MQEPERLVPYTGNIEDTIEYALIQEHYGNRRAERSGVPLMNHIDEGLKILRFLDADLPTMGGYCLHPLVQDLKDLQMNHEHLQQIIGIEESLQCAMNYRLAANAFLCREATDPWGRREAEAAIVRNYGLLDLRTRYMLIADKVQNKKDFMKYHWGTHARSSQLLRYFDLWLEILGAQHEFEVRQGKVIVC
uniref:Uncharacterized protein n=1 Tax=Pseudomonas phage HRDY3 TaxID=3236930 RepID=A0AB39CDQ2_9VIRU